MAFPEFDPVGRKLLWFSRGRGRGHAIPDIEIAKELQKLDPAVQLRFVSYGTGARTLEKFGYPLIDLALPDMGSITDTTVMAGRLVGWLQPDLVVSHEEFSALPAAKIFERPTVAILDFFTDGAKLSMQSLRYADRVIFTDYEGMFEVPPFLEGKVSYVGPVLRPFSYSREDRGRARSELGIAAKAKVVAVLPGSWTEAMAPVAELVIGAFDLLASPKHLIWVAGADAALLAQRLEGRGDVTVLDTEWTIERVMVAANVVITKSNRKTLIELEALGVPSVSLTHGLNPTDDARARRIEANRTLDARRTAASDLAGCLTNLPEPPRMQRPVGPAAQAAARIMEWAAAADRRYRPSTDATNPEPPG
ncbi:MAG: hypothetical protein SFV51_02490 [Bryobacteraceae bacterium]|nr:hypothetical protein [Bryobacteraceae bacterium]